MTSHDAAFSLRRVMPPVTRWLLLFGIALTAAGTAESAGSDGTQIEVRPPLGGRDTTFGVSFRAPFSTRDEGRYVLSLSGPGEVTCTRRIGSRDYGGLADLPGFGSVGKGERAVGVIEPPFGGWCAGRFRGDITYETIQAHAGVQRPRHDAA